ncbi:MAG: dihydroorotate dehydrogenase (quinone), partial [Thermoanaerobaculia bacterium]|nr:dihydroorotate dehydrogenase (quinone) [Thermoanaerobaculia bacterium]
MDPYRLLRPVLFRFSPERAHEMTLRLVGLVGWLPPVRRLLGAWGGGAVEDPVELWDLTFPNRVGLAAGYDKDGRGWRALGALGFGHLELGTVTPEPQAGNPRPRVFRLPEDRALINRLGFPSRGMERFAGNLPESRSPGSPVLGINLGKQRETPLERAEEDYVRLLEQLGPRGDYVAINVSSPNTPELRRLQGTEFLDRLVRALLRTRDGLPGRRIPLLVKLAPDLSEKE